jgi:hypothetical protein
MSAETDLYAALAADATVAGLVAVPGVSPTELKIYPNVAPQDVDLPAIVFARPNTEHINTIHGGAPIGATVTQDLWCMSTTRAAADQLADAAESALGTAGFLLTGRRAEIDPDDPDRIIWATVLTVDVNE